MAKDRVERDEEDLVRLYLTDIGQYPLLTKDDEVRLAQDIEAGVEAKRNLEEGGKELTPSKKRELRRLAKKGDDAERTFVQRSRSSTGARASSSRPMRPGGSDRPSRAASRTPAERFVCQSTRATHSLGCRKPVLVSS